MDECVSEEVGGVYCQIVLVVSPTSSFPSSSAGLSGRGKSIIRLVQLPGAPG